MARGGSGTRGQGQVSGAGHCAGRGLGHREHSRPCLCGCRVLRSSDKGERTSGSLLARSPPPRRLSQVPQLCLRVCTHCGTTPTGTPLTHTRTLVPTRPLRDAHPPPRFPLAPRRPRRPRRARLLRRPRTGGTPTRRRVSSPARLHEPRCDERDRDAGPVGIGVALRVAPLLPVASCRFNCTSQHCAGVVTQDSHAATRVPVHPLPRGRATACLSRPTPAKNPPPSLH